MVRSRRLELPRVAPQRPQRCASTNSATTARGEAKHIVFLDLTNHKARYKPIFTFREFILSKLLYNPIKIMRTWTLLWSTYHHHKISLCNFIFFIRTMKTCCNSGSSLLLYSSHSHTHVFGLNQNRNTARF